jgi:micrococcal nuclease
MRVNFTRRVRWIALCALCATLLLGCDLAATSTPSPTKQPPAPSGETTVVTRIIDGDTIDVQIDGASYRVRYTGVNTPERDEPCYEEASAANAALVQDQSVTLVKDVSETDVYGRLLRYVYVGNTFVNAELVAEGYAEAVVYPPDTAYADTFASLEASARAAGLGCHPTGIFDDGSTTR